MTPVRFAIDSAPDSARITPTNCTQTRAQAVDAAARENGWLDAGALNGDQEATTINAVGNASATAKTAGMFWPEIINQAHDQQHADRGERDVLASKFDPVDVLRAGSDVTQEPTSR